MKRTITVFMAIVVLLATACTAPIPPISPSASVSNATITVDNATALVELAKFSEGEMGPVTALAFTPDNAQLRVVHTHATPMLRHWDVRGSKMLAEYNLETVGIGAAVFDGTAHSLALSGVASERAFGDDYMTGISPKQLMGPYDGIKIIDAESGQQLNHLPDPGVTQFSFHGVAFSQNGRILASEEGSLIGQLSIGYKERHLYVFEMAADRSAPASLLFSTAHSYSDFETAFALDVEGRLFAVYADNGLIQLWDLESQQEWGELKLNINPSDTDAEYLVTQMTIAPTRQWLAASAIYPSESFAPRHQYVTLWQLDGRQVQWQVEIDDRYVDAIAFNPFGTLLAAGGSSGIHIWNAETGEEVKTFPGESAYAVAFSQDGSLLAWGDETGVVHLVGLPEN